ncbi:hypothetical protein D3C71_1916040 [compost metagenome]
MDIDDVIMRTGKTAVRNSYFTSAAGHVDEIRKASNRSACLQARRNIHALKGEIVAELPYNTKSV